MSEERDVPPLGNTVSANQLQNVVSLMSDPDWVNQPVETRLAALEAGLKGVSALMEICGLFLKVRKRKYRTRNPKEDEREHGTDPAEPTASA
jgi:hypothetical protein